MFVVLARAAVFVTHGRAHFPQDSFHMQEEIADDEPCAEGTSIERVESFGFSALISEGAELLDRLQPEIAFGTRYAWWARCA